MGYKNDIFISYSRHYEWPKWVKYYFIPALRHWLCEDLGKEPEIFFDEMIDCRIRNISRFANQTDLPY